MYILYTVSTTHYAAVLSDMNECSHAALSSCSRQADCTNTEGAGAAPTAAPAIQDLLTSTPTTKGFTAKVRTGSGVYLLWVI
jgi:hypothetical protein